MDKTRRIVAWSAYPVLMMLGIKLHYLLLVYDWSLELATYIPITIGALIITALELKFSYRNEWIADRNDLANDVSFMVLVQILLPKFLSFFVAITLLQALKTNELTFSNLWPHDWPNGVQVLLMLLSADFLRYWLHRAAHEWNGPLWRLHAVHHSPKKLYWVNVGRFHPIEKAIQYFFDALPFIILGVSKEVLALYFVFYSINGFFQHCNIRLRLGWLNYVVSGPELHRWHHSRKIKESNNNYGNNFIVWDLLFGTYFLPKDRVVGELGLLNRNYPLGFLSQLKTPFIKAIDKEQTDAS
jgi:sterol desaturase/sphingolipid hydroxylase (fatty acid hydroxylase superfamily)